MTTKRRFLLRKRLAVDTKSTMHTLQFDFCFLDENLGILLLVFFLSDAPSIFFFLNSHHPTLAPFCKSLRSSMYMWDRAPESGWRDACQRNQGETG